MQYLGITLKWYVGKKTWQVESIEHIEQYHIKFVETSHYAHSKENEHLIRYQA